MMKMAVSARKETGLRHLCMAGGVALNCVGNGKILRDGPFDEIWIQPAAGDAGGALGVALSLWHRYLDKPRESAERLGTWKAAGRNIAGAAADTPYADGMSGSFLGPRPLDEAPIAWAQRHGYQARRCEPAELAGAVAQLLADEKVVGLCQGRMEFGPRALGGRSIIGDARSPKMQSVMNLKIKFRESFRPFAPSVLREDVAEYFELDGPSPYMLIVAPVQESRRQPMAWDGFTAGDDDLTKLVAQSRSDIPAATHVDYSARVQTVDRDSHADYYDVINAFKARTGCGVVVNTSFNVRGEPIVCTPDDAYRCFMRTDIDLLVMERCVLKKSEQPPSQDTDNWKKDYELD
jgi:carbamoyltransferase